MTKASNVGSPDTHRKLGVKYFVFVWPLFFAICFGLGYPSLSRYDPRQVEGLSDVANYYQLATGEDHARATDQKGHDFELGPRQLDQRATDAGFSRFEVHLQRTVGVVEARSEVGLRPRFEAVGPT